MESQEPFKTIFKILNISGVWGENSARYKRFSFLAYVFCVILPGVLHFLSAFQAKTAEDAIGVMMFTPPVLITLCFTTFFVFQKDVIYEYLKELHEVFSEYPEAKSFIDTSYRRSKILYFALGIFEVLAISFSGVMSLMTGTIYMQFFVPEILHDRPETFYSLVTYQTVFFFYAGFLLSAFQELFFLLLVMIHGYFKFCESQFHKLDILKCVELHLNLKRLATKYNQIFSIPLAFQGLAGAYMMCGAIFISLEMMKNAKLADSSFLILYAALVLVQLFKPCYIGELIESGTNDFIRITFDSNWIEETKEFKGSLIILNENLRTPVQFHAFHLFLFNLRTYTSILNTVYTTYAFLANIKLRF